MNKLSDRKEFLIDKMICLAYPVRVICEVVKVSRNSVLVRRGPMVLASRLLVRGLPVRQAGHPPRHRSFSRHGAMCSPGSPVAPAASHRSETARAI